MDMIDCLIGCANFRVLL